MIYKIICRPCFALFRWRNLFLYCICLATVFFLGFGCKQDRSRNDFSILSDPSIQSEFDHVEIKYAKNFEVTYAWGCKIVQLRCKLRDQQVTHQETLVLKPRGQTIRLPEELSDAYIVEIPLKTSAANDDGLIMRIAALGLKNDIVAMGGGGIFDLELRKRWEQKKIASIGYSFHSTPQPEILLERNPDITFLKTYDHQRLLALDRVRQLGITAVPCYNWAEESVLGNTEWIKFTSLFFNKEKEATTFFDDVESKWNALRKVIPGNAKMKAFWLYFPSEGGDWTAHKNDYISQFIEVAGAVNVLKDPSSEGVDAMNNEQLFTLAKDADFWIVNSRSDDDWPPSNFLMEFKSYRSGKVYHYQKRTRYEHDAYDWYETPEIHPELVLEDLISIFYPDLLPNHETLFFEKVKLASL